MTKINKVIEYLVYLLVFLLPWQTVWLFKEPILNGAKWQYGTMGIYGTEILLWVIVFLWLVTLIKEKRIFKEFSTCLPVGKVFNFQKILSITIILFILWAGLSIIWAGDKPLAFYYWLHLLEGAALFGIFLKNKLKAQKFSWVLVLSGVVQAMLAILQFLTQEVIGNKWLGLAVHIPADTFSFVVGTAGYRWLRAYGSFAHPNILAGFLVICFLLCLFLYFKYRPGWLKILNSVFLIIIFTGLFFTFSRGAWLAVIIGYLIFIIIKMRSGVSLRDPIKITIYLLVMAAILFIIYKPLVLTRVSQTERLEIKSTQERIVSLSQAKDIILAQPILGVGLGNYTYYLYQKNPTLPAWAYQPAHNLYLLIFSELGIVGVVVFVFLCFCVLAKSIKNLKNNPLGLSLFAVIFIIGLFDHYLWTGWFGIMFLFLVLALTIKNNQVEND